eukprot:scaffold71118_cov27-Phaeocystis_antarctica.AAC.1
MPRRAGGRRAAGGGGHGGRHTHRAVGTDGSEHVHARREGQVVDLLVVGDELRLGLHLGDVPDGAGRVDGRGADDVGVSLVPVEGSERRAKLGVLILCGQTGQVGRVRAARGRQGKAA